MNPVYNPAQTGVPYANPKGIGYPGNMHFYVRLCVYVYSMFTRPGLNRVLYLWNDQMVGTVFLQSRTVLGDSKSCVGSVLCSFSWLWWMFILLLCLCDFLSVLLMEAGFPVGYAPAYTPGLYPGANPAFPTGKRPHMPRIEMKKWQCPAEQNSANITNWNGGIRITISTLFTVFIEKR